jgi:short-subunit dehydrogenase
MAHRSGRARDVAGKTVVVTGASAGVGRATALAFARAGARLGLVARDAAALQEVKRAVEQSRAAAVCEAVDVADADALDAAAGRIERTLGPIEVWVNDAMVTVFSPAAAMTAAEYRRVTEVSYLGFVHGTLAALRRMRPRDRGVIVQIGSALGYRGIPLQSAYCAAKHAIRGFTASVRSELIHARSGVAITMLELPAVNTPQFDWARSHMETGPRPVAPVFEPEAVADAVVEAARRRGREYWLGWSAAKVILGNMAAPGVLDRVLARRAWEGQSTGNRLAPTRPDNLEAPVPGLHRARGSFTREARRHLPLLPAEAVRFGAALAGAAVLIGAGYGIARLGRRTRRRA